MWQTRVRGAKRGTCRKVPSIRGTSVVPYYVYQEGGKSVRGARKERKKKSPDEARMPCVSFRRATQTRGGGERERGWWVVPKEPTSSHRPNGARRSVTKTQATELRGRPSRMMWAGAIPPKTRLEAAQAEEEEEEEVTKEGVRSPPPLGEGEGEGGRTGLVPAERPAAWVRRHNQASACRDRTQEESFCWGSRHGPQVPGRLREKKNPESVSLCWMGGRRELCRGLHYCRNGMGRPCRRSHPSSCVAVSLSPALSRGDACPRTRSLPLSLGRRRQAGAGNGNVGRV